MDELEFARELADTADEISMRHFGHRPTTWLKNDGSPVTLADREVEQALRVRVALRFPGHALFGEEEGLQGDASAPMWVVDPIDGTANYAAGIPVFATLIGLRVDGRTEVGVVSAPALHERYEAAVQDGARMNGAPIHVSDTAGLAQATVCFGSLKRMHHHGYGDQARSIITDCKRDRGFGDFWGHMLVARGAIDAMAEPLLEPWDVIALEVIVNEAGGRITNFKDMPYPGPDIQARPSDRSCLSTNTLLHPELTGRLGRNERPL